MIKITRSLIFASVFALLTGHTSHAQVSPKDPAKKRLLYVTATGLNQIDRGIIDGLKADGVEVLIAVRAGFGLARQNVVGETQANEDSQPQKYQWVDPSLPKIAPDLKIGEPPAGARTNPTPLWNDALIPEFDGYIISNVAMCAKLAMPWAKIIRSGKLIVFGESPSVPIAEKAIVAGEAPSFMGRIAPYNCTTGGLKTLSYNVYSHTWHRKMKIPTDEGDKEFLDKVLIPKIKAAL